MSETPSPPGGSVSLDENGYDEPPRTTGNRMFTDAAQALKPSRSSAFQDGRRPS